MEASLRRVRSESMVGERHSRRKIFRFSSVSSGSFECHHSRARRCLFIMIDETGTRILILSRSGQSSDTENLCKRQFLQPCCPSKDTYLRLIALRAASSAGTLIDRMNLGFRSLRKNIAPFCLSERSEESLFLFLKIKRGEIPRFARRDKITRFFRTLFSPQALEIAEPARIIGAGKKFIA